MLANALSQSTQVPPHSQSKAKEAQPVVLRMTGSTVFYEAVAAALESEQIVWDFGCGNGLGSALLRKEGRQIIGIDCDPPSTPDGAGENHDLRFCTDLESAAKFGSPDVIVIADVLGYLENPLDTLLLLAGLSKPTTQLLVFEPRANVTQQLPLGKKRAYSAIELAEQTTIGGWNNASQHEVCQTFVALSAERAPVNVLEALADGTALTLPDAPNLSVATHVAAATRAIRAKDGEQASQLLIRALQLAPTNTHALCSLARFAQVNGSIHETLQLLRHSLALDPTNLQAMQLWLELVAANSPKRPARHLPSTGQPISIRSGGVDVTRTTSRRKWQCGSRNPRPGIDPTSEFGPECRSGHHPRLAAAFCRTHCRRPSRGPTSQHFGAGQPRRR